MLKRFLFLAILIIAASPRDAIAEKPEDVFGFKWKMSYAEANKIASGKLVKKPKESHFGKSVYDIENPKEPSGASSVSLSFFNDELYSVNVAFWIKSDYDYEGKLAGIIKVLESKHSGAEMSKHEKKDSVVRNFDYRNEAGAVTENPYNLEGVSVLGLAAGSDSFFGNMLSVSYSFYGAADIYKHIKNLKNEKEFGDF